MARKYQWKPQTRYRWKAKLPFQDEFGIVWRRAEGGHFAPLGNPLREATVDDLAKYPWPDPLNPGRTRGLRERAARLHATGYAVVLTLVHALEQAGISVEFVDLSEILGRAARLKEGDAAVKAKLQEMGAYVPTPAIPNEYLLRMAKFGAVVDGWMAENDLVANAIQCWTALEEFYGVVPTRLAIRRRV